MKYVGVQNCLLYRASVKNALVHDTYTILQVFKLGVFFPLECLCSAAGSVADGCEDLGGQCSCGPYRIVRDCSKCAAGSYYDKDFGNCVGK